MKKLTKEAFIDRATKIHNGKYDYSLVVYKGNHFKVKIVCPIHGEFEQTAGHHLNGSTCPKCSYIERGKDKQKGLDFYLKAFKEIHHNKYTYGKTIYPFINGEFIVTCLKHGDFKTNHSNHMQGSGCPYCSHKFISKIDFVNKSNLKYNNKYDYSLVDDPVSGVLKIKCPYHGFFYQTYLEHTRGRGDACPICHKPIRLNTKHFIQKAKKVHGNFYNYSLVDYKKSSEKVEIICPTHGVFKQTPNKHLAGNSCPKCKASRGELKIEETLKAHKMIYTTQFWFNDCRNKKPLPFDFAVFEDEEKAKLKCLIEYDGKQHFEVCQGFHMTEKDLVQVQARDRIKTDYCTNNNIKLIRIPYWDFDNIETILMQTLTFK